MNQYYDYGYVKVHRKIMNWEWYKDVNTCRLFEHLLYKVNWTDKDWRGIHCERGQVITSIDTLSKETGLSHQQVRTALKHLISTSDVTSKMVSGMRVITVVNWDCYQSDQQGNAQASNKKSNKRNNSSSTTDLTGDQQANQQASNNNIRNNKNNKNENNNEPSPLDGGSAPDDWTPADEDDWIVTNRGNAEQLTREEFKAMLIQYGQWHDEGDDGG